LASTYNGSTLSLYVNGVLVATQPATGNIIASNGSLRLGGNSIWSEFFAGTIDDVRIYNRPLSQSEIQIDMNTPIGTTPPNNGLAAAYNFDEGAGTTVRDSSGFGNTGTISGATRTVDGKYGNVGTGTIVNDDGPPSFSIDDVTQSEGDSGTTAFVF